MRRLLILVMGLLVAVSATAATDVIQSPAYKECIALVGEDTAKALNKADEWQAKEPGIGPLHCRAMALYGLKRYKEAAETLAAVRKIIPADNIILRSFVSRQASASWVKAEHPELANDILSTQINDLSQIHGNNALAARLTSDLLLERARLNVAAKKLSLATKDLDHAISLNPVNSEALLERARVFEMLHDYPLARADAEAALTMNPRNAKARQFLSGLEDMSPATANE